MATDSLTDAQVQAFLENSGFGNDQTLDIELMAAHLNKARHELADATIAERNAAAHERLSRAYSEQLLVDEVGGDEKALGSNEDARKRRFRIELDKDPVYQSASQALDVAVERLIVATRDFECAKLNYDVALMRAGLYR